MAKFDQGGGCPCGLYRECEPGCAGYIPLRQEYLKAVEKAKPVSKEEKLWEAHRVRDDLERAESQLRKAYNEYVRCKEKINKS